MKNLSFSRQLFLGILLVIICDGIAIFAHIEVFENVGLILYGLLFLINPVMPQNVPEEKEKITKIAIRIFAVLVLYAGVTLNGNLLPS